MKTEINIVYLTAWMAVISLGMFQFGYELSNFNILTSVLYKQYQHEGEAVLSSEESFNSVVTTMIPVGAAIGSFTGGQIWKLGRRNAIFIINAIIVLGSGLTMIFSFWPLILGRLLLGFASGSFTVVWPLFVSETSPSEVAGPLGGVNQFACCFGIMVADILGFAVPYSYVEGGTNTNPEVYTTQSWRGVFILPAGLAVVQSLLLLVMFRNDTPKYYKQKGNDEAVKRVETLIFKTAQVDPTPEIQNEDNAENQQNDQESPADGNVIHDNPKEVEAKITVRSLFTVKYRKAFFVAFILAALQQLTGIMIVIFYSNVVFTQGSTGYNSEKQAKIGTMLVGVVNWATAFVGIPLLVKFGRKTLLIFGQIGMGFSLLLLAIFSLLDISMAIKILTLCFISFFEFSIGPVMFLYIAEITVELGVTAATLIFWAIIIIFGMWTTYLFSALTPAGVYFLLTGISVFGLLFMIFIIKETKGKSKEDLKSLYYSEKSKTVENQVDCKS